MKLAFVVSGVAVLAACGGAQKPAPTAPTCETAVDHLVHLAGNPDGTPRDEKFRAALQNRCTTDQWSAEARSCFVATTSTDDEQCDSKLTPEQQRAFKLDVRAAIAATSAVPPECAEYEQTVARVVGCDQIDKATRDQVEADFNQFVERLSSPTYPEEQKASLIQVCPELVKTFAGYLDGFKC